MIHECIPVTAPGSGETGYLYLYFLESSEEMRPREKRPVILMCPGGGYAMTSDREAEPMAMQFLAMGYHVAILRYSVAPARYPTALYQLAESVLWLKRYADRNHIDPDRIILQGCSAGGHLAASYGVAWQEPFLAKAVAARPEQLRVAGLLLCYPVITSGEKAHRESFENLLGDRYGELREEMSLERRRRRPRLFCGIPLWTIRFRWKTPCFFLRLCWPTVFLRNCIFTRWAAMDCPWRMRKPAAATASVCRRNVRAGSGWRRHGWNRCAETETEDPAGDSDKGTGTK